MKMGFVEWRELQRSSYKQKKQGRFLSPASFQACTLPQVLCQNRTYCSGVSVPAQAERAVLLYRTTASATEQKERTPVVFALIGVPIA
jgi:hypothetical protein